MENSSQFPTGAINLIKGRCIYLEGNDIDTDRIIPARFLKCVSFNNLGSKVFADDRNELNGLHPFDLEEKKRASILIVRKNFGCGSSREHAPQALMRWGIRAIIGESFAEIFFGNCLALGIPCVILSEKQIYDLKEQINKAKESLWELNLNQKSLSANNKTWEFKLDSGARQMLLSGRWDATSSLRLNMDKVKSMNYNLPYLKNFE